MRLILSLTLALGSTQTLAQTRSQVYGRPLEQQAQTVYVRGDVGMTNFASEAAGSKETATTSTYHMGAWAGESRSFGISFTSSEQAVKYALNGAEQRIAFQDVRFMARFGWVTPSLGVTLGEVDVKQNDTQTFGVLASEANAGLNVSVPMTKTIVIGADTLTSIPLKHVDKLNREAKLKRREELDLHAAVDVTERALDFLVGFRARRFGLEDPTQGSFDEKSQGAYAGLRLGAYF